MILNCYLFVFRVQSKQKKANHANISLRKCTYKVLIEHLKDFFDIFKCKTKSYIEKGRSHHCGLPSIRELFKKSSYYQYVLSYQYIIVLTDYSCDSYVFSIQYSRISYANILWYAYIYYRTFAQYRYYLHEKPTSFAHRYSLIILLSRCSKRISHQ